MHEFADDVSSISAGFAEGPGATFDIDGPELDRDRMHLSAGFAARHLDRYQFSLNYLGDIHHALADTLCLE